MRIPCLFPGFRFSVACISAIVLFSGLSGCQPDAEPAGPNVVLILADDLGYNDLTCYRESHEGELAKRPTATTPNIDCLADQGMRFTDFYCGAAVCSPSRAALLTGRNCTRTGIYNWIPPQQPMHLRESEVTLGEMLGAAGYRTAHFGKWHLTAEGTGQPLPGDQGYGTTFFTYNNAQPSHQNPVNFLRGGREAGPLQGYSCQLVMDEALKWLQEGAGEESPFYINIWFNEPHEKVAAPDSLKARHSYNQAYYGCIENMDHAVGRLLRYMEEQGLEEETLVIFTSDNGSQVVGSNKPLRGEKAFNLEGGIRVPFLVRWPGAIPAGVVSNATGSFTDVLPTLGSMTGIPVPSGRILDGEDLSPILTGKADSYERETPVFFFRYFHDPVCMLREGKWVLLGYQEQPLEYQENYDQRELANLKPDPDTPRWSMWNFQPRHMEYLKGAIPVNFQLFDMESDIGQMEDLSERHPEILIRMKKKMFRLREEMIGEGGDWYAASGHFPESVEQSFP